VLLLAPGWDPDAQSRSNPLSLQAAVGRGLADTMRGQRRIRACDNCASKASGGGDEVTLRIRTSGSNMVARRLLAIGGGYASFRVAVSLTCSTAGQRLSINYWTWAVLGGSWTTYCAVQRLRNYTIYARATEKSGWTTAQWLWTTTGIERNTVAEGQIRA